MRIDELAGSPGPGNLYVGALRTGCTETERSVRSPRRSAVAAALLVSLTACSPSVDESAPSSAGDAPTTGITETAEPSGTDASPPDAAPPADDALLAFTGRQLDGGTFDGSALTGDVIVWFWTPW